MENVKKKHFFGKIVKSDIQNKLLNTEETAIFFLKKNPFSKDASNSYKRIIHLQNTAKIQVRYSLHQ